VKIYPAIQTFITFG